MHIQSPCIVLGKQKTVSQNIRPMVLESKKAKSMTTENRDIWLSEDRSPLNIAVPVSGWVYPQAIRLPSQFVFYQHSKLEKEILAKVLTLM